MKVYKINEYNKPLVFEESWEYGSVSAVIHYDISYVMNYLDKYDISSGQIDELKRVMDFPVSILKNINVFDEYRNQGNGNSIYFEYEEFAMDNGALTSILVVDVYESQNEGFVLSDWYESLGYTSLGKLGDLILMYKFL